MLTSCLELMVWIGWINEMVRGIVIGIEHVFQWISELHCYTNMFSFKPLESFRYIFICVSAEH